MDTPLCGWTRPWSVDTPPPRPCQSSEGLVRTLSPVCVVLLELFREDSAPDEAVIQPVCILLDLEQNLATAQVVTEGPGAQINTEASVTFWHLHSRKVKPGRSYTEELMGIDFSTPPSSSSSNPFKTKSSTTSSCSGNTGQDTPELMVTEVLNDSSPAVLCPLSCRTSQQDTWGFNVGPKAQQRPSGGVTSTTRPVSSTQEGREGSSLWTGSVPSRS